MKPPEHLKWTCGLNGCTTTVPTTSAMVAHLKGHGETLETWPDGEPVVDASNVAEVLLGGGND